MSSIGYFGYSDSTDYPPGFEPIGPSESEDQQYPTGFEPPKAEKEQSYPAGFEPPKQEAAPAPPTPQGPLSTIWNVMKDVPTAIGGPTPAQGIQFAKQMGEKVLEFGKGMYQGMPSYQETKGANESWDVDPNTGKIVLRDPAQTNKTLEDFSRQVEAKAHDPFALAGAAATALDPTGSYMGASSSVESGIRDIRNKNWGGLPVDVAGVAGAGLGLGEMTGEFPSTEVQPNLPGMEGANFRATIPETPYVKPPTPVPDTPAIQQARAFAAIDVETQRKAFELQVQQSEAARVGDHTTASALSNEILKTQMDASVAKRNWQPPTPPVEPPAPVFGDMSGAGQPNLAMNLGPNRAAGGRFAPEPPTPPEYGGGTLGPPITSLPEAPTPTPTPTPPVQAPPVQAPPPQAPVGTGSAFENAMRAAAQTQTPELGPERVEIRKPGGPEHQALLDQGYVKGPVSSNGYPTVIRPDIAGVPAAAPAAVPKAATRIGPNQGRIIIRPGEPVIVPTDTVNKNKSFVANMKENGYKRVSNNPDGTTTFEKMSAAEKLLKSEEGSVNIGDIRNALRRLFGREPYPEEVQKAAFEQNQPAEVQPGEATGRVASFDPGFIPEPGQESPADAAKLQEFLDQLRNRIGATREHDFTTPAPELPFDRNQNVPNLTRLDPRMADRIAEVGSRAWDFTNRNREQPGLPFGPAELRAQSQLENISNARPTDIGPQPTQPSLFDQLATTEEPGKFKSLFQRIMGSEDIGTFDPKGIKEPEVVRKFRDGLPNAEDWKATRFILPDGTRKTHPRGIYEHGDSAAEVGTTLPKALQGGIIRVAQGGGGAEVAAPITEAQSKVLSDLSYYSRVGMYMDVTNYRNRVAFDPTFGERHIRFPEGTSANVIRSWVNSHFDSAGNIINKLLTDESGSFTPGEMWQGTKNAWQKIKDTTGWSQGQKDQAEHTYLTEALNVPSAVTTTGDFSWPGRQGLGMIHTPQFWQGAFRMFKGLSDNSFRRMQDDLRNLPIAQEGIDEHGNPTKSFAEKEMGLVINEPASEAPMNKRMEMSASKWVEVGVGNDPISKAWKYSVGYPIRATNRAFITMSNQVKFNRAQYLVDMAQNMAVKAESGRAPMPGIMGGITLPEFMGGGNIGFKRNYTAAEAADLNPYHNLVLAREIGDYVNTAVGQAPKRVQVLPWKGAEFNTENATSVLEKTAKGLNSALFAPGLFYSRARFLSPATYIMASPIVRQQYLTSALAMGSAWYAFTELAKNSGIKGVSVSNDPTSSDFGKVKIGNLRLDPGGGFLQFLVLLGRAYKGGYTSSSNPEQGFHKFGVGYQAETQLSNALRFGANKLNPAFKFAYDFADASQNKPFHVWDRTLQMFVPLFLQDLYEVSKSHPTMLGALGQSLSSMFGVGTQTYSKGESISKFIPTNKDWLISGGGAKQFIPGLRPGPMEY